MIKKISMGLLLLFLVSAALCACGKKEEGITEYLSLGQKYLLEEDYDQAIVALEKAIEIDEKCVEAYLGLADAYCGKKDYGQAARVLEEGYLVTGDARLTEKKTLLEENSGNAGDAGNADTQALPEETDQYLEQLSPLIAVCENFDSGAVEEALLSEDIHTLWEQAGELTTVSLENGKTLVLWSEGDEEFRDVCLFYGDENGEGFQLRIFMYQGEENGMEWYEGSWKDGLPNGEGTVTVRMEDGMSNRYHGNLLDGKWDGAVYEEPSAEIDFPGCTYQFTDGVLQILRRHTEPDGVEYCVVSIMDDGEERDLPADYVEQSARSTWGVTGFAGQGGALE